MSEEQWWLVTFGDMLHWARLTRCDDGTAEVLSANGEIERFQSEDDARAALLLFHGGLSICTAQLGMTVWPDCT